MISHTVTLRAALHTAAHPPFHHIQLRLHIHYLSVARSEHHIHERAGSTIDHRRSWPTYALHRMLQLFVVVDGNAAQQQLSISLCERRRDVDATELNVLRRLTHHITLIDGHHRL